MDSIIQLQATYSCLISVAILDWLLSRFGARYIWKLCTFSSMFVTLELQSRMILICSIQLFCRNKTLSIDQAHLGVKSRGNTKRDGSTSEPRLWREPCFTSHLIIIHPTMALSIKRRRKWGLDCALISRYLTKSRPTNHDPNSLKSTIHLCHIVSLNTYRRHEPPRARKFDPYAASRKFCPTTLRVAMAKLRLPLLAVM